MLNTVAIERSSNTQQVSGISEISPLSHNHRLPLLEINSENNSSMETTSRNILLKIILDAILLATRKSLFLIAELIKIQLKYF